MLNLLTDPFNFFSSLKSETKGVDHTSFWIWYIVSVPGQGMGQVVYVKSMRASPVQVLVVSCFVWEVFVKKEYYVNRKQCNGKI